MERMEIRHREGWHASITNDILLDAARRYYTEMATPGFCLACGAECDGIPRDTCGAECDSCGSYDVYSALELFRASS
jgi:hypothetical protein